ncbi:MAG: PEP-CTERM system histidine kinase PrsK [Gammaproteobacteria bacterium]|nr:PEP-CTERM system histidine kinase PrsK [Gammaproteobacteria bacterium]
MVDASGTLDTIAATSYGLAALSHAILLGLLLSSWRGRFTGLVLVLAVAGNLLWASLAALIGKEPPLTLFLVYRLGEALRYLSWFALLFHLLKPLRGSANRLGEYARHLKPLLYGLLGLTVLAELLPGLFLRLGLDLRLAGYLGLSLGGLVLVEQLYRQTRPELRWGIKFLCLSLGSLFVYDFYLYSDALLFQGLNRTLWAARGFICALAVPLLAVTVARNPTWSILIFVSRAAVIRSASVLAAGVYLLLMAGSGYYIKLVGGDWADALQVVFVAAALMGLAALIVSGQLRARVKVFFNKHFFSYKYDYREEWLRFIRTISSPTPGTPLYENAVRALGEIVDAPGGLLWAKAEDGRYRYLGHANRMPDAELMQTDFQALAAWLEAHDWVIELAEYRERPELYSELELPAVLVRGTDLWLVVPLQQRDGELAGFILLTSPRAPRVVIWEDRDLLKTAGRQIAGYVALSLASEALVNARQFEAFNRLSAFVVHDLKNVVAQLNLVVKNAERHKGNPAFIADAFATVDHASAKMERMLAHLRKGGAEDAVALRPVALEPLLREAQAARSGEKPEPGLEGGTGLWVRAEHEKLLSLLCHLLQNAQEATAEDGWVRLSARREGGDVLIGVADNGCGMDEGFVRERLFRPFDTTKGNAGMGIGVYQSREIVKSFGGEMTVDSAPGRGTTFLIRLALAEADPMDEASAASALPVQQG